MNFSEISDFIQHPTPNPTVCDHCGGQGEIIYGDGGGAAGVPTSTGYTEVCSECKGTGTAPDPLLEVAEKKMGAHAA